MVVLATVEGDARVEALREIRMHQSEMIKMFLYHGISHFDWQDVPQWP